MVQCMTNEVQFCYVCFECICISSMTGNPNIIDQLCILTTWNIIHAIGIGTNNRVECGSKLCDFLQQSNQKKICDNKIYCKIFLVPPLHIIYDLWTWLFVTCSHMHWQFWNFVISLY
jgi:hypothetical protein